jgi:hypothetical protein
MTSDPLLTWREAAAIAAAGVCAGLFGALLGIAVTVCARKARWAA